MCSCVCASERAHVHNSFARVCVCVCVVRFMFWYFCIQILLFYKHFICCWEPPQHSIVSIQCVDPSIGPMVLMRARQCGYILDICSVFQIDQWWITWTTDCFSGGEWTVSFFSSIRCCCCRCCCVITLYRFLFFLNIFIHLTIAHCFPLEINVFVCVRELCLFQF